MDGGQRIVPAGGAYRIRTGVNGVEGRCATAAPILRITAGLFSRRAVFACCQSTKIEKAFTSALLPMEGRAGIEPASFRCAADVLT